MPSLTILVQLAALQFNARKLIIIKSTLVTSAVFRTSNINQPQELYEPIHLFNIKGTQTRVEAIDQESTSLHTPLCAGWAPFHY